MQNQDNHKYDDIINLPHPVSEKHPQMSLYDRAAQFAPFAALTGHAAAIRETARRTSEKRLLSEETAAELNEKLNIITENLGIGQKVSITYFVEDDKKSGGAYITKQGEVAGINLYRRMIVMTDKTLIPIDAVSEIEGELFSDMDIL